VGDPRVKPEDDDVKVEDGDVNDEPEDDEVKDGGDEVEDEGEWWSRSRPGKPGHAIIRSR
jgi:hypothetical protein